MGYSCDRFRSYDRLGLGRIFGTWIDAGGVVGAALAFAIGGVMIFLSVLHTQN